MRVESDAGDVEEGAIVEHADVDGDGPIAERGRKGGARIPGHAQAAGKAVAGTSGDESERGRAAGERAADFVDGAVASPDDHEVRAIGDSGTRQVARVSGRTGHIDRRAELTARQLVAKHVDSTASGVRIHSRAGDRIDDRGDAHVTHDVVVLPAPIARVESSALTKATNVIVASHAESCGPPDFALFLPRRDRYIGIPLLERRLRSLHRCPSGTNVRRRREDDRTQPARRPRRTTGIRRGQSARRPLDWQGVGGARIGAGWCAGASC